jgi:hypothetical protein
VRDNPERALTKGVMRFMKESNADGSPAPPWGAITLGRLRASASCAGSAREESRTRVLPVGTWPVYRNGFKLTPHRMNTSRDSVRHPVTITHDQEHTDLETCPANGSWKLYCTRKVVLRAPSNASVPAGALRSEAPRQAAWRHPPQPQTHPREPARHRLHWCHYRSALRRARVLAATALPPARPGRPVAT